MGQVGSKFIFSLNSMFSLSPKAWAPGVCACILHQKQELVPSLPGFLEQKGHLDPMEASLLGLELG